MTVQVPRAASRGEAPSHFPDFLRGGGEMGALMRGHDWSTSSLGAPSGWPQSLRTSVRLMLNTGHPMYIWWGADGACLYNDAYRESIGPERHPGSLGRPAREVWEEIWHIIGPQIQQVRDGRGATWNVNHLVPITRHGRREDVYWTYSYSPIDDESSPLGIGGVLVICTETTAQVMANKRIAAERDQLGQLFEQAPAFMALLSGPQHRVEIANPSYMKLVGNREVLGKTVAEALPEAVEQGFLTLLDRVYSTGEAYIAKGAKFTRMTTDGSSVADRYVDFVYQPVLGNDGAVIGIFVEGADVTDREQVVEALRASEAQYRQLAEELTQANRTKDEFLAMLGHELRNPLAPIVTALALMKIRGETKTTHEQGIIERQVKHLVRLVDDLLDVSRITRGLIELRCEEADLSDVLAKAVEMASLLLEQRKHRLVLDIQPGLRWVGDPARLAQVVSNLLTNAARYTSLGGEVQLRAWQTGPEQLCISVRDNGIGIAPDMLSKLFDLFFQGKQTLDRPEGGLGIGLALVKSLVELHGGKVRALSGGPGLGSEFIVELPLRAILPNAESSQARAAGIEQEAVHAAAPSARIVIVDDNVDNAKLLGELMAAKGYAADIFHDPAEALANCTKGCPDLAILDIGLPVIDGYELARRMRQLPNGDACKLIALSGYGQREDRRRSEASGFHMHLVKPAEPAVVIAAVQNLLASSR